MCGGREIPTFHRVLERQYLNDLPGDTFYGLLQLASAQGKPASVTLQALDDDGIRKQ